MHSGANTDIYVEKSDEMFTFQWDIYNSEAGIYMKWCKYQFPDNTFRLKKRCWNIVCKTYFSCFD